MTMTVRSRNAFPPRLHSLEAVGLLAAVALLVVIAAPTPAVAQGYEVHVNAGGSAYVDEYGNSFQADKPYTPGSWGHIGGIVGTATGDVYGTIDDPLYHKARGGFSFSYQFDGLNPGLYELKLYFNEHWMTERDLRIFDISVEGSVFLADYDPFFYCGTPGSRMVPRAGTDRACSQTFEIMVTDGQLNLDWTATTATLAFVSAISVRSVGPLPKAGYSEVSSDVGILGNNSVAAGQCFQSISTGSAWTDFDRDDDLDLYVTNHMGANYLYRNEGDLNGDNLPDFVDVAVSTGSDDSGGVGQGATFIDYDNDGDQDLFLTNWGPNVLLENQLVPSGVATFVDVTGSAGLGDAGRSVTAAWGDYDIDGDLDLYITNHFKCMPPSQSEQDSEDVLYRNNGDGTFTDVSGLLCPGGVAPCPAISGLGFAAGWVDYDNDADMDLYLVNDMVQGGYHPNVLWRNDGPDGSGGWIFTDVSAAAGVDSRVNGMGLAIGDFDMDRDLDFAFSNINPNNLLLNNGNGTFREVSAGAGVQRAYIRGQDPGAPGWEDQWTWGSVFFDHDNDAWLDLLYGAGYLNDDYPLQPAAFFWNRQNGQFRDISATSGLGVPGRVRGISIADFDEDGFLDVFMNNYPDRGMGPYKSGGAFWLWHNEAIAMGNTSNWLKVTVEGTTSNRDGIGSRIWVRNAANHRRIQVREISSCATHGSGDERAAFFGLAGASTVDLRIRWPNGTFQTFFGVAANQHLHLVEP